MPGAQFVVARAPNLDTTLFTPIAEVHTTGGPAPVIVETHTDEVLGGRRRGRDGLRHRDDSDGHSWSAMVVVYRVSPLTYWIGKRFVRVETYGMVNLVSGERIVPELIQDQFTAEAVAAEAVSLLTDTERVRRMCEALDRVRAKLGDGGASQRAARAVLAVARGRRGSDPVSRLR